MQPGNIPSVTLPPEEEITPGERRGSAVAHGAGVLVAVPLIVLGMMMGWSPRDIVFLYIPAPIVAYLIARSFRRRRMSFGSFQGMQATVIHLIISLLLLFVALFGVGGSLISPAIPLAVVVLFIYSVWGAWDTLFGEDFSYIGINRLLRHVSDVNLQRREQRRRFGQPYQVERSERDDERRT